MKDYNLLLEESNTISEIDLFMDQLKRDIKLNYINEIEAKYIFKKAYIKADNIIRENTLYSNQNFNIVIPDESDRTQGETTAYFKIIRGKIHNVKTDNCLRILFLSPNYLDDVSNSKHTHTDPVRLKLKEKDDLIEALNSQFKDFGGENSITKKLYYDEMLSIFIEERDKLYHAHQDISYLPTTVTNWIAALYFYNKYNVFSKSNNNKAFYIPLITKMPDYTKL